MHNNEDLPSINDILEDNSLPSYKDFIEELPSVEEVLNEGVVADIDDQYAHHFGESQTIEDAEGNAFLEVTDVVPAPEWSELVRMVNDVRKDIPEIPEIKYYDDQLAEIVEQIKNIQKNVDDHGPRINAIDLLSERIEEVNESIPTFPDWVRKVEEIPDFSWIGKSFSLFEVNFKRVQKNLDVIRESFERKVESLNEVIDVKEFESKVDIKTLTENLEQTNQTLEEQRQSILKEYKETVTKLYEFRDTFKDDDRKLKKSIASEQNKLQQSIEKQLQDINEQSIKADETILGFYTSLKEEIAGQFESLPEIKDYDEDISRLDEDIDTIKRRLRGLDNISLKKEIKELGKLAENLKKEQARFKQLNEELQEGLLNQPPSELQTAGDQTDPLTPLDQQFATLEDLQKHYRLFINRITQQLSTLGGGGAVWLWDLQDVNIGTPTNGQYPPLPNNSLLIYKADTQEWVGIASTAITPDIGDLNHVLGFGNTSDLGMSVGFITATGLDVSGQTELNNLNITGIATFAGTLDLNGNVDIDGHLEVDDINVSGALTAATAFITGDFDVDGTTNLDGVDIDGNVNIAGNVLFSGGATNMALTDNTTGALDIKEGTTSYMKFDTTNDAEKISIGVTAIFTDDVTIPDGALSLGSTAVTSSADEINTLHGVTAGTVSPSKALVVDADKDLSGIRILTLEGWLIAPILDISGNVDIDGITNMDVVDIDGATHIDASLDVTGQTTLNNLQVSGVTTFSGTLDLDGDVDIDGHLEVDNLGVSGVSTFTSDVDINADLDVSGVGTITTLFLNSGVGVNAILDEDNMSSDASNALATQQSIKAFVGLTSNAMDLDFQGDTGTGQVLLNSENMQIRGTSGEIVTAVSGTGVTIAMPQDVTIRRDLDVLRNLNVVGNVTIGGTGASLVADTLQITDADIILGFTTNSAGENVSNDTTANHGGIAIASTEGTPVVTIAVAGIDTIPPTYKKFMWFKKNTFAGMATDAFIMNYGLAVGTTSMDDGTRLAVGDNIQLTDDDIFGVRNINTSGIITAPTFVGDLTGGNVSGNFTGDINSTGISTFVNVDVNGDIDVDGHTELDNLNVTGVATFSNTIDFNGDIDIDGHLEVDDLNVTGVSTFQNDVNVGVNTNDRLNLNSYIIGNLIPASNQTFNIGNTNNKWNNLVANNANLSVLNMGSDIHLNAGNSGIITSAGLNVNGHTETDSLNVSGIATFAGTLDLDGDVDIDGHLEVDNLNVTGVSTFASAVDINSTLDVSGQTELDDVNISGIATFAGTLDLNGDVDIDGHLEVDDLNVTGVSTFASAVDMNSTLDVSGQTELDDVNISGIATFAGTLDLNGDVDIDGHLEVDNLGVAGVSTFSDTVNVIDNKKLQLGNDGDLQIYHGVVGGGSSSYIDNNTGPLYIRNNVDDDDGGNIIIEAKAGKASAVFQDDEGVRLYFNDAEKFETTADGINVTGHTETDSLNVSGIATFSGTLDLDGDVDIDGHLEVDNLNVSGVSTFASAVDINSTLDVSGQTELDDVNISGIATFAGTLDLNGDVDIDGHLEVDNLNVSGVSTFAGAADFNSDVDIDGQLEVDDLNVTGIASFAGTLDLNGNVDIDGHLEVDNLNVSGVSTFASPVDINSSLDVSGQTELDDVNISGIATFAGTLDLNGDVDIDGHLEVDNLNVAGVSTFNGNMFVQGSGGGSTTDYSEVTLSSLSPSSFNVTYERQSTGFVLDTGTVASGNALFHADSNFYYYVATSGGFNTGRILIWSVEDNNWVVLLNIGEDYTEGNVTNNEAVGTVAGTATVTASSQTEDGRSVPQASSNIVYATSGGGSAAGVATITTAGDAIFSGVVTATTFNGNLTGTVLTAAQPNITSLGTLTGLDVSGQTELDDVNISGIATFAGTLDLNGDVDIDGHLEVDNLNVTGVSTFASAVDINSTLDVSGQTELDDVNISGIATFAGTLDLNGNVDIDGHLEVDNLNVAGVATFQSDVNAGVTTINSSGIEVTGVVTATTFDGNVEGNLTGTVLTAAQPNITSLGTLTGLDVNGHTELDNLNVSGVSTFASAVDVNSTLDVSGQTELDDVNISGIATFAGTLDLNGDVDIDGHLEVDNLGVSGVSTFASSVDMNAGVTITGTCEATDFNSTSDIRLKTDIQSIEDPLSKLMDIEGVSFKWMSNNKPALGVIADNIEKVLPELVSDSGTKSVNYNGLVGLLIECVKEQQVQIENLKKQINN